MGPQLYGRADFLSPQSCEIKGFLRTRKAAIAGAWRRPVADVAKYLLHTTCRRRNIGFCWYEAVTWFCLFVFSLMPGVSADHSCWGSTGERVAWGVSLPYENMSVVWALLFSAGGAYTMNSFTWGVGGQTGWWGVVVLIWHTWKWSSNLLESFMIRSSLPRNIRGAEGKETDAKAWIFLRPPLPEKGNISKCNEQKIWLSAVNFCESEGWSFKYSQKKWMFSQ